VADIQKIVKTHLRGNPAFSIEKFGQCFAVDSIFLLVNQPPGVFDGELSLVIVDPLQCDTLLTVSRHAQILDTVQRYQASWARAISSIFDASQENSVYLSEITHSIQVEAATDFSG
jgi:hypothetical protein